METIFNDRDELLTLACQYVYGGTRSDAQAIVEAMSPEKMAQVMDALESELMK